MMTGLSRIYTVLSSLLPAVSPRPTLQTGAVTAMAALGMMCLIGCTNQPPTAAASSAPAFTVNTPLDVIEVDPRGKAILIRDVPDIMFGNKYQVSGYMTLEQIADLNQGALSQAQLTQVQADLAELSAEEQPGQNLAMTNVPAPTLYTTSFPCEDGNTPVQNAVCENQQLAALDVQLAAIYRERLGAADVFERDQLLAAQRAWVLSLPDSCDLTGASAAPAGPVAITCLATAYQTQIAALTNWSTPAAVGDPQSQAIAHYVSYKLLDTQQPRIFDARLPTICADIAGSAAGALSDDGAIDPTQLDGAQEIAGSHGPASGADPQGGTISVDLYRAGLYGGYQIRARSVSLSGAAAPLLGPTSVGDYVQTLPNGGGRYVSFASQTGDYGDIDVFTFNGQLLALMTDTIGYDSPAPPGEAAVAAIFTIANGTAAPACLYETFLMPPPLAMGTFGTQPSLTPFLALIDSIQGVPPDALAPSDRQDTSYLATDTRWTMLNMPLVTLAQLRGGNWTGWLRYRHDQVLDSLYAWSQKSPQNQAQFNRLFALLRPAAVDLNTIYVQQQGLSTSDAEQATALAMMELLYQSTINFAPGLAGGPADPAVYKHYQPRYPILASPQS
jgi:uncharacterized protein